MYSVKKSKSVRTTIMLPLHIEKELRVIQADLILRTSKQTSLSTVIRLLLDEALEERTKKCEMEEKIPQYSF